MKEYIDKAALVAAVKERLKHNGVRAELDRSAYIAGKEIEDEHILALLDTIEVKKVDFSNSFDATVCKVDNTYLKEMDRDAIAKALELYKDGDKVKVIIIAQKGE